MPQSSARERLIGGAIELMRRNGAAGTGVSELVAASGVARRSLYVNFPGGKDELVAEATSAAGRFVSTLIRDEPDPVALVRSLVGSWRGVLVDSDFRSGCPVAAAALAGAAAPSAPAAAGAAFGAWRDRIAARFADAGLAVDAAASLSYVAVSAIEGAVLVAIAERSVAAVDAVEEHLVEMVRLRLGAAAGDAT